MDPLSALSLAACVLQVIDFSCKVVSEGSQIFSRGSAVGMKELKIVSNDLSGMIGPLQERLRSSSTRPPEEQCLIDIGNLCMQKAEELSDCLSRIIRHPDNKHKVWDSLSKAVRTVWYKERVQALASQLESYRSQLSLRLLTLLDSRAHTFQASASAQLSNIERSQDKIVEVLTISFNALKHGLQDRRTETFPEGTNHADTAMAVAKTVSGRSLVLRDEASPKHHEAAYSAVVFSARDTFALDGEINVGAFSRTIRAALFFQEMNERQHAVANAHDATFDWVFKPTYGDRWADLPDWIAHGTGCYWINGKAGSGKSTLMRFISESSILATLSSQWGGSDLILAPYFFWWAGTSLQRSQEGLLRALLYHVLNARPDLAAVLFPDQLLAHVYEEGVKLSLIALKRALQTLSTVRGLRIFLLIDGLDEYTGDVDELCEALLNISSSSIKILASSRPIPSCTEAFQDCPQLRLQDLTHHDIINFATSSLQEHRLMSKFEAAYPGSQQHFVNDIAEKASGVFLWVALVVHLLKRGLRNYDTLEDLQRRLDLLPPELEALYDHMLASLDESGRIKGMQSLSFVLTNYTLESAYPITTLQLSYAELQNVCGVQQSQQWRCEATEGRVVSRCCGLLEFNDPVDSCQGFTGRTVTFLHRTVVEFLQSGKIASQIRTCLSESAYTPFYELIASALAELQDTVRTLREHGLGSQCYRALLKLLSYCGKELWPFYCDEILPTATEALLESVGRRGLLTQQGSLVNFLLSIVYTTTTEQMDCLCEAIPAVSDRGSTNEMWRPLIAAFIREANVEIRQRISHNLVKLKADDCTSGLLLLLDDLKTQMLAPNRFCTHVGYADSMLRLLATFSTKHPDLVTSCKGELLKFMITLWKARSSTLCTVDFQLWRQDMLPITLQIDHLLQEFTAPCPQDHEPPRRSRRRRTAMSTSASAAQSSVDAPWARFVSPDNDERPAMESEMISRQHKHPQSDTTWATTKRSDRLRLLNMESQELVLTLSRIDLSAKEQRKALAKVTTSSREEQDKIWSCVQAIKAEQQKDQVPAIRPAV